MTAHLGDRLHELARQFEDGTAARLPSMSHVPPRLLEPPSGAARLRGGHLASSAPEEFSAGVHAPALRTAPTRRSRTEPVPGRSRGGASVNGARCAPPTSAA